MATSKLRIRPDKGKRKGDLMIYVQVCIDGKTKLFSTGQPVNPDYWDAKNQKVKKMPESNEHVKMNLILEKKHQEIKQIIFDYSINDKRISFDSINSELQEEEEEIGSLNFIYCFNKYYEHQSAILKSGTLRHYRVFRNQIIQFKKNKDFLIDTIDYNFYKNFTNWLIKDKNQANSTVNKRIKLLKSFLRNCAKQGKYDIHKIADFTNMREITATKIALSEDEMLTLWYYDFSNNTRLEKARDLFILACVTGLRESDIQNLKKENVSEEFISLNSIKTSGTLTIPLNKISKSIFKKYKNNLPKLSQVKLNLYLKEIGKIVGLIENIILVKFQSGKRLEQLVPKYELLSSHVGRRTFITLSILKGIPTPVIQSITGHKDLKSFQKYIQLNNNDKMKAMKLWD
jgi:integrase